MSLRTRIFLIFSALATIPLLVLTLFSYQRYVKTTHERMDSFSDRLLENATSEANRQLEAIRNTSYTFNFYYKDGGSLVQELKPFTSEDKAPEIYQYYETYKELGRTCQNLLLADSNIYGIYIFTPGGYVFDYSNGENGTVPNDPAFRDDAWYQDTLALDGRYYISTVEKHSLFTGNRKSVFFSQSLKDVYSHKLTGVLLIDCDPAMFDLSSVNPMPDISLLTIDNTDTQDVLYTNYTDVLHNKPVKNTYVSHADLVLSPLQLTVMIDYDTLFKEYNVTGILLVLIGGIFIAGLILASFLISGYIVKPISHLSRKMASQKGHTLISSTRYLDRTDEIGTLYNEYNSMVEKLNTAVKQDYQDKLVILDAQMKSLEARINSHFLFNTLEAINSMAEIDENEQIATMSQSLGNMFRYALKTQSELVSVNDELQHVNDYVTIQRIRFDNRFRVITDMTEDFRQLKVLKLILQPLVENALYHGLQYCRSGDTIKITGYCRDSCSYIDVYDNGCGMDEETIQALQASLHEEASFTELGHRNKQSIGLKNIHSRIELYYGRGYGLTVTSEKDAWTNVQIRLPQLKRGEQDACTPTSSSTTKA